MSKPETILDIIAEMRIGVNALQKYGAKPRKRDGWMVFLAMFADRIDAAYKRELGNMQKMREALVQVQKKINYLIGNLTVPNSLVANRMEINGIINAALAAPARNCDVGTAEEQAKRFYNVCKKYKLPQEDDACEASCPMLMSLNCELAWAQMPYEKEARQ